MGKKKSDSEALMTVDELDSALKVAEGEVDGTEVTSRLADLIRSDWQAARDARAERIDAQMLRNLRQWRGLYDPEKLAAIAKMPGGSKLYPMITNSVSTTLQSKIRAILEQNDPPWTLDVEPKPDLPPDIEQEITVNVFNQTVREVVAPMAAAGQPVDESALGQALALKMTEARNHAQVLLKEEAKGRVEGMDKKIRTQWDEGGGPAALNECIVDYCRNVISVLKGPVLRNEKSLSWVRGKGGKYVMKAGIERRVIFERRPPENIYPLVGTTDIRKGGLIDFYRFSRADINKFLGLPGYNDKEIRAVLSEYDQGGLEGWVTQTITSDVAAITKEVEPTAEQKDPLIDALNYWGSVPGSLLIEYGLDEKRIPDPDIEYEVEAWLIGRHVIRCVLNPNPLGEHPYSATGYGMEPGQFWYLSLCEQIRAPQMLCCDAFLDLRRNIEIASGPIPEVDYDRVPNASNWQPEPWAPVVSTSDQMSKGFAVKFNDIPMKADPLMAVYDKFEGKAYMDAGIPNPTAPDSNPTLGGASIAETAKNLRIQLHVDNIEANLIAPAIARLYNHNMLFDEDESIKTVAKVTVKGIHSLVAKELKLRRRQERIAGMNNPTDLQITGMEGRKNDLEDMLKEEGSDPSRILKGDLNAAQQGQAAPPAKPAETDAAGNMTAGRDFSTVKN